MLLTKRRQAMEEFKSDPLKYIPYLLAFEYRENRQRIAHSINAFYFNPLSSYDEQLEGIEQV